jgi:cytochrome c oxidase subunit II
MKRRFLGVPIAAASITLLSSCGHPFSTLAPGGPAANKLAGLGWFVYILTCAVALIMWILIAWISLRKRGTFAEHAPIGIDGGQGWILIGGFLIPFLILAALFVLGLDVMAAFPLEGGMSRDHPADIRVVSHQWWWEIHYVNGPLSQQVVSADEIHIPVGRPVDIDLLSDDVIHSFFVPTLHGKVDLIPGQVNRIRIQAARAGVYQGRCAEYCGAQHAHMEFMVVAQDAGAYAAWKAREVQDAQAPADPQQQRGEQLVETRACSLCHTIRGTMAQGRVGPDLTHVGSRLTLAAGTLTNNTGNMEAWITHAQSLKPEVIMPDLTEFSGPELLAISAYLEHLQ